jgi:ABC-type Fe3+-hydroxamate transport system substrate-binding protein
MAVAIVAILAASCAAVYLMNGGGGGGAYRSSDDTGRLMVYGNANNDDYLDGEDLEMLERIISGDADETPYADANRDGNVDRDDVALVERMIKREEMTIKYDYYRGGRLMPGDVKYPITASCVIGTDAILAIKSIGGVGAITCVSVGSFDRTMYSDIIGLPSVGENGSSVSMEEMSKYDVSAMILMDTPASSAYEYPGAEAAGIDIVRISARNAVESIAGVITLGYLFQCEERANRYAEFCDGVLGAMAQKVGPGRISDSDRVTALCVTMVNSVSGTSSDYYAASQIAGAINIADWASSTKTFARGDEWLLEAKYRSDYIIHNRSIGYDSFTDADLAKTWGTYSVYFEAMDAYKDGRYIILNANMPVPVRIAYMASIFYPEIFGADYGDKMHQRFIDSFMDNLSASGYDVTEDGTFLIKRDMIKA